MAHPNRVAYVDGLRGIAVVAMFFVHAAVAWLSPEARSGAYFEWSMVVSGMVAPVFLFLVGMSMALVAERERAAGVDPSASRRRIVRRGAEIVAIGYALHLAFYALDGFHGDYRRIFKVDVLHCIGLSMIVYARLAWPSDKANFRALIAFVLLPALAWLAYRLPIEQVLPPGLAAHLTTKPPLALFPFVPYAAWVGLGLFVAPWWLASSADPRKESRFGLGLLAAGALLWLAGKAAGRLYYQGPLDTLWLHAADPPQSKGLLHLFLVKGAYVLVLFAIAHFTRSLWRGRLAGVLLLFGRRSLVAYGAHLIVIYPLAGPFLSKRLLPSEHAALTLVLTAAMYVVVVASGRLELRSLPRRLARALTDPKGVREAYRALRAPDG